MLIPSCLDSGLPIAQIKDVKNQLQLDEDRTQLETPQTMLDKTGQVFAQWERTGLTGQAYKQKSCSYRSAPYRHKRQKGIARLSTHQTIPFVTTYYSSVYWYRWPPCSRKRSLISCMPAAMVCASATSFSYASALPNFLRMFWLMAMEQNFGPHIEQKCAIFAGSAGKVSSWNAMAVSGS